MPRRENKTTPKVIGGWLYTDTGSFSVESAEWWAWLEHGETFYLESNVGTFTARRERRKRTSGLYWYAFRRAPGRYHQPGKLHKLYLGKSEELTNVRLHEVARQLADRSAERES